jgi:hypothetical protein
MNVLLVNYFTSSFIHQDLSAADPLPGAASLWDGRAGCSLRLVRGLG